MHYKHISDVQLWFVHQTYFLFVHIGYYASLSEQNSCYHEPRYNEADPIRNAAFCKVCRSLSELNKYNAGHYKPIYKCKVHK